MLTPQNFREKTFERAVFGGYDMAAVDDFLEEAANDYSAIAKENMVLKSKMKVLVEKIEEYRTTEDSMRLTLLSAQKLCAQLEQETKERTDTVLADARLEAEQITREAHNQRIAEDSKLLEVKKESTKYIEGMRLACAKHLEFLEKLDNFMVDIPAAPPAAEAAPVAAPAAQAPTNIADETVRIIESSVERQNAAAAGSREIARVVQDSEEAPAPDAEPTRQYNGGNTTQFPIDGVKFGK